MEKLNTFFSSIYEFFYYRQPFSDDIFDNQLYFDVGLFVFISSLLTVVIYYYIINRPRYNIWTRWLFFGFGIAVINFVFSYYWIKNKLFTLGYVYVAEYYWFAAFTALISFIFYFILSQMLRWWSSNCKGTPFPH